MLRPLITICLLGWVCTYAAAQESLPDGNRLEEALLRQDSFRRFDILPAISYAPETKLTLGGIGYWYFNLGGTRELTRLSNVNFLAVYTTAQQIALETEWDIFTSGNRWRLRGQLFYNRWPDRNYGKGNDAGTLVREIEGESTEVVNYLRYNSDRIQFAPVVLRQLRPGLYIGGQMEVETLYRVRIQPDDYRFLNADSLSITQLPIDGLRSGLGAYFLWDTRDYVLNPIKGTYVEFGTLHNGSALGSDYAYHSFRLDWRQYINTTANHTLALRSVLNLRYSAEAIPIRGLSRVGGRWMSRGYFQGTYQDDHMLVLEAEYRWPFWRPDKLAPFWKMWKRLGIVLFASASQTFPEGGALAFDRFRPAAGAGLRILFNEDSRVNLRIDYAFALARDSGGPGQRQSGLYFYLAEAF